MVAEYMRKEYRPYAISDLVLNLHNKINKVSMAKILDELVDENTVITKRYGKLSFYCCSERKCEANDKPITLEMLRELDNEIDILKKDSGELICGKLTLSCFLFFILLFISEEKILDSKY